MGRLLIIIGIAFLVWLLFRFIKKQLQQRSQPPQKRQADEAAVEVLPCAYCGVHVPRNTAVFDNKKCYCSREHRDADR